MNSKTKTTMTSTFSNQCLLSLSSEKFKLKKVIVKNTLAFLLAAPLQFAETQWPKWEGR